VRSGKRICDDRLGLDVEEKVRSAGSVFGPEAPCTASWCARYRETRHSGNGKNAIVRSKFQKEKKMDAQQKEADMMHTEITKEVRAIFKANMKIFDWDIPENDQRKAATLILDTMQSAIDELRKEVEAGEYDNY
jgi:hypothetical protein